MRHVPVSMSRVTSTSVYTYVWDLYVRAYVFVCVSIDGVSVSIDGARLLQTIGLFCRK